MNDSKITGNWKSIWRVLITNNLISNNRSMKVSDKIMRFRYYKTFGYRKDVSIRTYREIDSEYC